MKILVLVLIGVPVMLLFVGAFVINQVIKEIDLHFENDDDDYLN